MLIIPNAVFDKFIEFIREKGFSADVLTDYKKWLRYYLDFCDKYPVPDSKSERVRMFDEKLTEKEQTEKQSGGDRFSGWCVPFARRRRFPASGIPSLGGGDIFCSSAEFTDCEGFMSAAKSIG